VAHGNDLLHGSAWFSRSDTCLVDMHASMPNVPPRWKPQVSTSELSYTLFSLWPINGKANIYSLQCCRVIVQGSLFGIVKTDDFFYLTWNKVTLFNGF
jgi:hypothetical protein